MAAVPAVVQMITRDRQEKSRDRVFMTEEVKELINSTWDLQALDSAYTIVSIIGPQSTGKSTLLNKIFQADFAVMGSNCIPNQTTRGIWVTVSNHPRAIVIDTEGADGMEEEDDTSFENQSALLALLISDVIFINLWCNEISRKHGGFMTTLAIMLKEMTNHEPRRTRIVFAVHDYNDKVTDSQYRDHFNTRVHKIWSIIPKTGNLSLTDYIEIYVELFPSPKQKLQEFEEKCKSLCSLLAGGEFCQRMPNVLPAKTFPSAARVWRNILRNERLHLPATMVVMCQKSCESIMREKLQTLESALLIQTTGGSFICPKCFLIAMENNISYVLYQYEHETLSYGNDIANEIKERLKTSIIEIHRPAFQRTLEREKEKFLAMTKKKITADIYYKVMPSTFVQHSVQEYSHKFNRSIADLDYYHDEIRNQENIFFEQLTHFAEQKATEIVAGRWAFCKNVMKGVAVIGAIIATAYGLVVLVRFGVPIVVEASLPFFRMALKAPKDCWMFLSTIVNEAIKSDRQAIVDGLVNIIQTMTRADRSAATAIVTLILATMKSTMPATA